jgi:hypothetical protein
MPQYGKKASEKVETAMHERKKGTLKSGKSGKKVKSRKQAIAIHFEKESHGNSSDFGRARVSQRKEEYV